MPLCWFCRVAAQMSRLNITSATCPTCPLVFMLSDEWPGDFLKMSKIVICISVGCVALVALLCVPQAAKSQELETNPNGPTRHIPGFSTEHRRKRSAKILTYLGRQAWKLLRSGATRVDSKLANVREYEKKGNYQLAVDQFLALEPKKDMKFVSDMKGTMTGMSAQVGDRTVTLKFPSNSQFPGTVTIQIYKTSDSVSGRLVDVIKYVQ